MDLLGLLLESDLFGAFDKPTVARIAASATHRSLDRNDVVFEKGDIARELFVVQSGRIAIANRAADGRESVLALMESGEVLGEMSLFDGEGRSADARALEPSDLVVIAYPTVQKILRERPELLWEVVSLMARRLRSTDAALADAVFLDVPGRTAKRLLEQAGDANDFVLPVTQEELASMVGASRERVNKAIAAFVGLGWITQSDRRYSITDRVQLERRAH